MDGRVIEPDISSDNNYLVFQVEDVRDSIVIKNLTTGELVPLTSGSMQLWRPSNEFLVVTDQPTLASSGMPNLQLDRTSVESVMEWLAYGDITVFEELIGDPVYYGHGFAGGRNQIPRSEFISMIKERIQSRPNCLGYILSANIWVFTSGWEPDWLDSKVSSDLINFTLTDSGEGYRLGQAYFQPAPAILDDVDSKPCPVILNP